MENLPLTTIFSSFFTGIRYHLQPFPLVSKCKNQARTHHSIVSNFLGTLVLEKSPFPFFMLVAFEAGGFIRALLLLLLFPLVFFLSHFLSAGSSVKLMIFVTFAGLKLSDIELISLGVLSKFYGDRIRASSYTVFTSFGFRCIVTELPRIMVEPFAKRYLGADMIVGTGITSFRGRATGLCDSHGVLVGEKKLDGLTRALKDMATPNVGLGDSPADYPFMGFCEESYLVPLENSTALPQDKLASPVIFHDGRLVKLPTPINMLLTFLWLPIGFPLALIRMAAGSLLPMHAVYHAFLLLGVRIIIRGKIPSSRKSAIDQQPGDHGVMFVCTHRSLLDPIFLSAALGRPVTAVTYSISRLSELLSPIPTARLTRDRTRDAANIRELLRTGDLAVCPEGTTCRTPYLLRFSALFAELTDRIVPVAMEAGVSNFHGSAARTWKGADPFYFFMNPSPSYTVTFLDQIPTEKTCAGGGFPAHDVANYIQGLLAAALRFQCTSLTRRDKYRALTGTDGIVTAAPSAIA
ncbi:hypothetical protein SELMODRAFT_415055 [Selaginella moellendorffii]|uniref:Uncharacterized protein GPAT4-2 n=2 Tax=Selaginella moellendorffii TaxID=88036 RepID=D8RUH4_SELML|nr:hypothetical protein SELMODRAFT_415055 [Selaginella moellendorffii]